jgi:cbb3-type cytochrome oxidase maturation protein
MNIIFLLAPFSVALGLLAVGAFFWTLRSGQYEDIQGAAARILIDDDDPDMPTPAASLTAPGPDEDLPG